MNVKFHTAGEDQEEEDKRFNPIYLAKDRLFIVKLAIERRYLKAPIGKSELSKKWC